MFRTNWSRIGLVVLIALMLAPAVSAREHQGRFELFFGYYNPDGKFGDSDWAYGLRGGWDVTDKFGMDLTGDFFDTSLSGAVATQPIAGSANVYDIDVRSWDYSFIWYPTGGGFYLLGGPGWTTIDINVAVYDIDGNRNNISADETIITVHGGLGYIWEFDNGFYLRPDARLRWLDTDFQDDDLDTNFDYNAVDFGVYVGFGWVFGG